MAENEHASLAKALEAHGIDPRWLHLILKSEQRGLGIQEFLAHWAGQQNELLEAKRELARRDAREAYAKQGIPGPGRPRKDEVQRVRTLDEKDVAKESVDEAISDLFDGMRAKVIAADEVNKEMGGTLEAHILGQARKAFGGRVTYGEQGE